MLSRNFTCNCGFGIDTTPPSENVGYLIWDSDVDSTIAERRKQLGSFLNAGSDDNFLTWRRNFYGDRISKNEIDLKSNVDVVEDILSRRDCSFYICVRCPNCHSFFIELTPLSLDFLIYLKPAVTASNSEKLSPKVVISKKKLRAVYSLEDSNDIDIITTGFGRLRRGMSQVDVRRVLKIEHPVFDNSGEKEEYELAWKTPSAYFAVQFQGDSLIGTSVTYKQ